MTKTELRKAIRLRLQSISAEARAENSAAICREVAQTREWRDARVVGFFSPLGSEPNVDLLWSVLENRAVCYPRVVGEHLVFIRVPDRSALLESRWNLLEPPHENGAEVPLSEIDLLLVPGMAFTRDGHRMGRGGGFYDRLLGSENFRAPTFGICFAKQIVPRLPMEDHDQRVKRVICGEAREGIL
ncbi:MAG: 5-formyltetrahydrofolate cyclo-ligase [Verrucomicrobiota bacterium]